MKTNFTLALFFATLIFLAVVSCKTKKPVADVKTSTIPVPTQTVSAHTDNTAVPKYNAEIKNILDKACLPCHASGMMPMVSLPPAGVALDSYQNVKASAGNKKFLGAINHEQEFSPMPAGGAAKLDDEVIKKITAWVQGGMPE